MTSSISLWGGMAAGMKTTSWSPNAFRTSSTPRRWPKWMGLNVPPKRPTLFSDGPFFIFRSPFLNKNQKFEYRNPKPSHSTHSTKLRASSERRFLPRFKNRGLAPSNVSIKCQIRTKAIMSKTTIHLDFSSIFLRIAL
jgi:hypothetical protein